MAIEEGKREEGGEVSGSIDPGLDRIADFVWSDQHDDLRVPAKTISDLEWTGLLDAIARHTCTELGHRLAHRIGPLGGGSEDVTERLAQIGELIGLLRDGHRPDLASLRDLAPALAHVDRDGVLMAEDLAAIGLQCEVVARIVRFHRHRRQEAPRLFAIASRLDACGDLAGALAHAIEPGGVIKDTASPDLRELRRAVTNRGDQLRAKVDAMLRSDRLEHQLQDDYATVRDGRYVLPIRVGASTSVAGIVHGYSATGRTAYVEPTALVELNNELRWSQIRVEQEEHRILERLSGLVAEVADSLDRNGRWLAYLDLTQAIARFSLEIDAEIPTVMGDRALSLRRVRHPLLALKCAGEGRSADVVANDVIIDQGRRALMISGPNTGGKTVLLKAIGLAALMVKSGLPIAAGPGSVMGVFGSIYTDVGDEQSIAHDLSTFSGHVVHIHAFVERSDDDSLVLLDELFNGTDPVQGAALARSLLETLCGRGSTVVVTTHLESLKTMAVGDDRFVNASMGFDLDRLSPTYHMTLGIPGSSYALRIARRLGLGEDLVGRAQEILDGGSSGRLEDVMVRLEAEAAALADEHNRLESERIGLASARKKYEEKHRKLVKAGHLKIHEESRRLKAKLVGAKERIRSLQVALSNDGTLTRKDLDRHHRELDTLIDQVDGVGEASAPPDQGAIGLTRVSPEELVDGMEVYVVKFRRNGMVLGELSAGQVKVQIGALKALVSCEGLYFPVSRTVARASRHNSRPVEARPSIELPSTSQNTVDLRGLRVDEAIDRVDHFLDARILDGQLTVHIIHGHGTGALKRAVRGHLTGSPVIKGFRPGGRGEGGDGVTIAQIKGA